MGGRQLFLIAVSRPFGDLVDEVVRSLRDARDSFSFRRELPFIVSETESFKYLLSAIPTESNPGPKLAVLPGTVMENSISASFIHAPLHLSIPEYCPHLSAA